MASYNKNLIFIWLLLGCVSAESLEVTVGADVTLTCKYDAQYYGVLSMCWGRGAIPNRGCAQEIIKTDGTTVTSRSSERYNLMGNLQEGDVSLTIRQVEEGDSGAYGCRVDIPGWFNDHKHEVTLTVLPGRPNPLKVEIREVKERTITVSWAHVFDGGRPIQTYRVDLKNKQASWDTAVTTQLYNPELTQVTLVDLRPAKTYTLRMFTVTSVGMSESSNVLSVTTKEAAPDGAPIDMQLQALSPHSIKVSWKPPRSDLRNGVLRSYSINYREYDQVGRHFKKWEHLSITATREVESVTLTNLKPSTKYGVLIMAKTNAGAGPAATAPLCTTHDEERQTSTAATSVTTSPPATMWKTDSSITSLHTSTEAETITGETTSASATVWEQETTTFTLGYPDPPIVELKEVKDFTISLLWIPGFDGGSPVTGYYLEYKVVNASWDYRKSVVDYSANQTEATIIEMTPSTYNIRMFAINSLGRSQASNVLTFTVKETGHQKDIPTTTPSTDTQPSSSLDEGRNGHLAAIVVPVVLVVLIVAIVTTWQLRRIKVKKGTLDMWLHNGAIRYRGAEAETL